MLLKQETTIKFQKPLPKVLCVSSAYKNTFVMVRMDKPCKQYSIVHFDALGTILFEHTYHEIIDSFGQMNDREVIVLDVPHSKIDIIHLQNKTVRSVSHIFLFEDTAQMTIHNFSETRLFCIQEMGTLNDNRLRLTYFDYRTLEQNSEPVAEYMSKNNEWTYDHTICKANNHSKILWFTYKHLKEVTLHYFDLRDEPTGKLNTVRAVNTLGFNFNIDILQVNIAAIWESQVNVYMVFATTHKSDKKVNSPSGVYNNNFILDATGGNDIATLRQTKFIFDIAQDGFSYNDQLTDCYGVGNISVFHTFRHEKGTGRPLETPIYYINNQTEEILDKETWVSSCYETHFYFPGWDGNAFIQTYHENADVSEMIVRVKKIMDPKEINLHLLLHLNQDFDDDLLQDALDLLSQ